MSAEFKCNKTNVQYVNLSNNAFNDLKKIHHQKQNKACRLDDRKNQNIKELCTYQYAETIVQKMVNITGIVDFDKETIVFHATPKPSFAHKLPKECSVKVYRKSFEFKQWNKFIKKDHYFMDKFHKQMDKGVDQRMVEKEKDILMRLQKVDVKCPRFITLQEGVLVTNFIGKNKKLAPSVKTANLTEEEYMSVFHQVIGEMKKMYSVNLVHNDLSEHNILWHNQQCYIANVGKCLELTDKEAYNALVRNCEALFNFFNKKVNIIEKCGWWYPDSILGKVMNKEDFKKWIEKQGPKKW